MLRTGWDETVQRARALAVEARSLAPAGAEGDDLLGTGPLSTGWLSSAAEWLAQSAPSWSSMAGRTPTERSYRRVFSSPLLEAWLICWPRDGHLELHDHGGASGAFQVVDGLLEEWSLLGAPDADGRLTGVGSDARTRLVGPGRPVAFDGRYIHDVRNSAVEAATSVHVYSAASRSMAFYRFDGIRVRTVDLGADRSLVRAEVEAERHGRDVAARAVHPSAGSGTGPAQPSRPDPQTVPG